MLRLCKGFVLAGVLVASSALAADGKNYAGIDCVIVQAAGVAFSGSTVNNPSTTTDMVLACPATKDANDISSGTVIMKDQHPSLAPECTLLSLHTSGSTLAGDSDGPRVPSISNSANWQTVNFGAVTATSNSYYWYACTIPRANGSAMSGLAMYKIVEND